MISFTKDGDVYFLPLSNKHGLSTKLPDEIFNSDSFSMVVRVKIDWDSMEEDLPGGIIAINGMHTGIKVKKSNHSTGEISRYIQCDTWIENPNEEAKPLSLSWWVEDPNSVDKQIDKSLGSDYEDIIFVVNKKEKKVKLKVNDNYLEESFTGDMVDYKDAMIWLGCCNGLAICPKEFQWNYSGEILLFGIFLSDVILDDEIENKKIMYNFLNGKKLDSTLVENAVCFSNLKEFNKFKIFDESEHGNHFVKYNEEWI
jgi:hypothetical protein